MSTQKRKKIEDWDRPNANDLKWEIIRRNSEYKADYKTYPKSQKWEERSAIKQKWAVIKMFDPKLSYLETMVEFKRGEFFQTSPTSTESPVQPFVQFDDSRTEYKKRKAAGEENFLILKIDPLASEDDIFDGVKYYLDLGKRRRKRSNYRSKITARMDWLKKYDEIKTENESPKYQWFRNKYKSKYESAINTYCRACLLVENPLLNPLREISNEEIKNYKHKNQLSHHAK